MVPAKASHKSGPDLCEAAASPHTNLDQICVRWCLYFDSFSIVNRFSIGLRLIFEGWGDGPGHGLTQIWSRFV